MIADKIRHFIDSYPKNIVKVDKKLRWYQTLVNEIPTILQKKLGRDDFLITGSVGQGNTSYVPWICIFNTNITHSAQHGIYIVFLFKSDMSGYYISLNQGITFFKNEYKNRANEYSKKVAFWFKEAIKKNSEWKSEISLQSRSPLAKAYESANVISRELTINSTDEEIFNVLEELIKEYDSIFGHIDSINTYDDIIRHIISDIDNNPIYESADEAIDTLNEEIKKQGMDLPTLANIIKVKQIKVKSDSFLKLSTGVPKKIDYVEKARLNAIIGIKGEDIVLQMEKVRVMKLLQKKNMDMDLISKVQWVSEKDDSLGYDIASIDIDDANNIINIYIEVKTTTSKYDIDFFVSQNEIKKSIEFNNNYWVYRLYNCNGEMPKFYIAKGKIENNFYINPVNFSATYKWIVG